jgi:hypothetical protein
MKTIANKVVKVLKEMDKSSFYRIKNLRDYEGNTKFMIQRSKEIYDQFNPMDKDVNFDFVNDFDVVLTWKKTGEKLSIEEHKTYFDSTVFTKIPKDQIDYEDYIVIFKDKHCIQVSGEGYGGGHLTCYDDDYTMAGDFEEKLGKLLPTKEVYVDGGRVGVWG